MAQCLGLYIEDNIIKYAKISKEHEQIKIESFGVKFYDNLEQSIKQIIDETYSYKTPISINLAQEEYDFFQLFSLLSKKDIPKAIKTEFESYCTDKNFNPNVFETRYALTPNVDDKDKIKVIHVSENKIELNKQMQRFDSFRLQNAIPISMSIPNIIKLGEKENCLVVNIEANTIITTIINQNIYDIKRLDLGSREILEKINLKENSYQKAYEICKETTIYTSEGKELSDNETDYLEDIMPTLYNIVGQLRKIINENTQKIDKIYITGTGALINNIDLYFEEYLEGVQCEILRPDFVKISPDINIKDYVEVNSAISLGLSGLGQGISGMNFKKTSLGEKISEVLTMEIGGKNKDKKTSKLSSKINLPHINFDFNIPLDVIEKNMLRSIMALVIVLIVYSLFSILIIKQIEEKNVQADNSISGTKEQISLVDKDIENIQMKKSEYTSRISNLEKISEKIEETNRTKKSIPILLNHLMYIMPDGVQITSIQNTETKHIQIQAQSKSYAQLGYLTSSIRVNGYLTNVISTSGQQENGIITIKIEGDLP